MDTSSLKAPFNEWSQDPRLKHLLSLEGVNSGDQFRLLVDGPEVFPRMLSAIRRATREIALDIYQFERDQTGDRVLNELIQAAKRGVHVRVIFDSLGSLYTDISYFQEFLLAGGKVIEFHVIRPWRKNWSWTRRDHRKVLLVDEEYCILGGLNIADEYSRSVGEGGYHDFAVEIQGPICEQAWNLFERTWKTEAKGSYEYHGGVHRVQFDLQSSTFGRILGNDRFVGRMEIRKRLVHAFAKAEKSIYIINPYFLPDPKVLRALKQATSRGVKVRIVMPLESDVGMIDLAARVVQHRLTQYGASVFLFPGMAHSKAVLVDECWVSIGSYNFDYQSLFRNLEVVLMVVSPTLSADLKASLDRSIRISRLISINDWRQLSLPMKLLSRLLYRFRKLL